MPLGPEFCQYLSGEHYANDIFEEFTSSISIGDNFICNMRFADDTERIRVTEEELQVLSAKLEDNPKLGDEKRNLSICLHLEPPMTPGVNE